MAAVYCVFVLRKAAKKCSSVFLPTSGEHLKPWLVPSIMDEIWRILKVGGQLQLAMPYARSNGFWQDPTHVKTWNEATPEYFDPSKYLYNIYKTKPFRIVMNSWQMETLNVVLEKIPMNHGIQTPGGYDSHPDEKGGK